MSKIWPVVIGVSIFDNLRPVFEKEARIVRAFDSLKKDEEEELTDLFKSKTDLVYLLDRLDNMSFAGHRFLVSDFHPSEKGSTSEESTTNGKVGVVYHQFTFIYKNIIVVPESSYTGKEKEIDPNFDLDRITTEVADFSVGISKDNGKIRFGGLCHIPEPLFRTETYRYKTDEYDYHDETARGAIKKLNYWLNKFCASINADPAMLMSLLEKSEPKNQSLDYN